ncbi:DUF4145 domain-containing protein [uncultured Lactobacillus sp.]|uniref:DUF4145 domain-containing protein n=1 Tax=uncultured Lactobacillus sp. TaxID=153152 RepID=UPI00262263CF|nr:DUF4145 domain-containing protein [uncultured Lactobacillus sp.]
MNTFKEEFENKKLSWEENDMVDVDYTCGYCGAYVSSDKGMPLIYTDFRGDQTIYRGAGVYICTNCRMPTFMYKNIQVPGNRYGSPVKDVPVNVNDVYEEARSCYAANAYTGTVLLCRKLLMHVAVDLGANENLRFIDYVNYLNEHHFVSVKSDEWIDQIRRYGNEATHEIEVNTMQDAQMILKFCEMLLKMNYEYPSIANND